MIGIPVALALSNVFEWYIHKHVLHGRGREGGWWRFHLHRHHANALRLQGWDPDYAKGFWRSEPQFKEVAGLVAVTLPFLPLFPVAPFFTGTVVYCSVNYYRCHRKAHLDPAWARTHLPWHYDHHMGPDQEANWCVTRPWADRLFGTRKRYVGTEVEAADEARRARVRPMEIGAARAALAAREAADAARAVAPSVAPGGRAPAPVVAAPEVVLRPPAPPVALDDDRAA